MRCEGVEIISLNRGQVFVYCFLFVYIFRLFSNINCFNEIEAVQHWQSPSLIKSTFLSVNILIQQPVTES